MATETIDYTIAANPKQNLPEVTVNLVLTYDPTAKRSPIDKQLGAYQVTGATGTYTETYASGEKGTSATYDITDIRKRNHAGDNDNKIYPDTTSHTPLDRYGVTFIFADARPHDANYVRVVNLFYNPFKAKPGYEQYSAYHARDLVPTFSNSTTTTVSAPVEADAAAAMCFASGTLIRTARGDVAVEALEVGDLALTASGALRPIRWIGRRAVNLRQHRRPAQMMPVRIEAHAFGQSVPARDLYLSPGHPVLVGADADREGGHLVPIMCLINGTTVRRVGVDAVTYWHVELDGHDILLAEGLPAESYFEYGDRSFFTRDADGPLTSPDLVAPGAAGRCRPVAVDGAVVEAERDRLDCVFATRLAQACAWPGAEAAHGF